MADNTPYYGDNLDVFRRHVKDETVDLVYLDSPFNANANFNVLFKEQNGSRSAASFALAPAPTARRTSSHCRSWA